MLRSTKAIIDFKIQANDGEIGRCVDFLFDDEKWAIRYMVADTGGWLTHHQVLVSPIFLAEPDWETQRFHARVDKKQIAEAPTIDEDAPVSVQHELEWIEHYGLHRYWGGPGLWGAGSSPAYLWRAENTTADNHSKAERNMESDHRLRSVKEVTGYHIHATDGEIGHVEEFIVDDHSWVIRYVVVGTSNWWPGRKVLIPPDWIDQVNWLEKEVCVDVKRDTVKNSPEYDPRAPVNLAYEKRLYDFYGRPIPKQ